MRHLVIHRFPSINGSFVVMKWYLDDILHKEIGPAVIHNFGMIQYWSYGKVHRMDGPAIIFSNGRERWYYQGKKLDCSNQEEFDKLVKLRAFW